MNITYARNFQVDGIELENEILLLLGQCYICKRRM